MAAKKKSSRKTTRASPKPRTKRARRPRIKIVVAQPTEAAAVDALASRQLVKVNSAVVRRRQKARSAGGAGPAKAVPVPAPMAAKAGTSKPQAKRGRKLSATTQFILSQLGEMPAADVVAAAAERGIKLNALLVHQVRSRYRDRLRVTAQPEPKASASSVRTTSEAGPTSKVAKAGTKKHGSASEFVREQPIDMPSREVVEKAEKLGIKLSQSLVRVTRFHMRHAGEGKPARAGKGEARRGRPPKAASAKGRRRGQPPAAARAASGPSAAEAQLRRLVVELGTARTKALVTEVERAIEGLISG
jgi:hypothetical protein